MALRNQISRLAGGTLATAYGRALRRGRLWSLPMPVCGALSRLKKWADYRLFEPVEDVARGFLHQHDALAGLPPPGMKDMSISPITAVYLYRLALTLRPRRILEFGSGLSTVVWANYAARASSARSAPQVVSFDHDKHWLEMTARRLESVGLRHYVRLMHAPLEQQNVGGRECLTYSAGPALVADGEAFDFLFIDGPPASVGRAACLPLVASRLARGATLLLDDAYRSGEQAAWQDWRRRYGASMAGSRMLLTDRGLAVGRWRGEPDAMAPCPATKLEAGRLESARS